MTDDSMSAAAGAAPGSTTGVCSPHAAPHGDGHHRVYLSETPVINEGGTSPYGGPAGGTTGGASARCTHKSDVRIPVDSVATGVLSVSRSGCRVNPANGESRGKLIDSFRGATPGGIVGDTLCYFL